LADPHHPRFRRASRSSQRLLPGRLCSGDWHFDIAGMTEQNSPGTGCRAATHQTHRAGRNDMRVKGREDLGQQRKRKGGRSWCSPPRQRARPGADGIGLRGWLERAPKGPSWPAGKSHTHWAGEYLQGGALRGLRKLPRRNTCCSRTEGFQAVDLGVQHQRCLNPRETRWAFAEGGASTRRLR